MNLGHLPELWQQLDRMEARVNQLRDSPAGNHLTARFIDEGQPAGRRA